MRVCYHLQTHVGGAQMLHLAETLVAGGEDCIVHISHDRRGEPLDVDAFHALPGVSVHLVDGGYGDFNFVRRWLDCVEWLRHPDRAVDWVLTLSGQDYPLRPIADIEADLASSEYDAFLEHFEALGRDSHWPLARASSRYLYRFRRLGNGRTDPKWARRLRPLQVVNELQPFLRFNSTFGPALGRRITPPFQPGERLYGGSFFMSVSWSAASYVADFYTSRPELVTYFSGTLAPDEVAIQTALVNAGTFHLSADGRRYFDFHHSKHNSPKTLGVDDLSHAFASGADFARKFDFRRDPDVRDALDEKVRSR